MSNQWIKAGSMGLPEKRIESSRTSRFISTSIKANEAIIKQVARNEEMRTVWELKMPIYEVLLKVESERDFKTCRFFSKS